jgi:hypothetical protein
MVKSSCCLPHLTIGGQDKDVTKLTDEKDKQRSHEAKSKKGRRSGSSTAEAEGEDEVLE